MKNGNYFQGTRQIGNRLFTKNIALGSTQRCSLPYGLQNVL